MASTDLAQFTRKNIAFYSGLATALAAGMAQAAPTATEGLPVGGTANGDSVSFDFDIDNNAVIDFKFYSDMDDRECTFYPGYSYFYGTYDNTYGGNTSYYAGLVNGDSISDALGDYGSSLYLTYCDGEIGSYPTRFDPNDGGTRGYVGVRFLRGDNWHYGYLDIEVVGDGETLTTTVLAACYESDPDTAIDAGACRRGEVTSSIPVGGAIPLTLGLLTIGAAALRRRRQNHQA